MDQKQRNYFSFVGDVFNWVRETLTPGTPGMQGVENYLTTHLDVSAPTAVSEALYQAMPSSWRDRVELIHGIVGLPPTLAHHAWLRIRTTVDEVQDINQDVIIDPAAIGISPPYLLVHQGSPWYRLYTPQSTIEKSEVTNES